MNTNAYERWTQIWKVNETNYHLKDIRLLSSLVTTGALISSILLAIMMGLIFIYGMVYVTNFIYQ